MGQVFASCGHEIVNYPEDEVCLSMMEYDREGERVVLYGSFCKPCAKMYEGFGIVLHTEQEKQDWLDGSTDDPDVTR